MLGWSLTFFIVATVSAILGFTGASASAAVVAQALFFLFLVLFLLSLVGGRMRVPII